MTIHEAIFSSLRQPLMTALLLLITIQLLLFFASIQSGRNRRLVFMQFLTLLFSSAVFYFPMLDITWELNYPNGDKARSALLAAFGSLPVAVLILFEILLSLLLITSYLDLKRYRNSHPTFESIKETMDLLPAGIAFGKPDGEVLFRNLAMNELSRALTGKDLSDLAFFRNMFSSENTYDIPITLPDGVSTWQFFRQDLTVDGKPYKQYTATNITDQTAVTKELEEKNKKLREIHMRLELYNHKADKIIVAQELLTARMAVHNEVGNVLLESRHYLKDPTSIDEELLLQALKNTNSYLLREYEEDDTERDPLSDALEAAETIGVDVLLSGEIPKTDPARRILAAAITECASNAMKHANGDKLTVDIMKTDKVYRFGLISNGDVPEQPIRETGGLRSLRMLVESENGSMVTHVSTAFELSIELPEANKTP